MESLQEPISSRSSRSPLSSRRNQYDDGYSRRDKSVPTSLFLNKSATSASLDSNQSIKSVNLLPEPKSPYSSITHKIREIIPEDLACKIGCGGATCKYCSSKGWTDDQMAIKDIFSHWYVKFF
jgi:hypothetical protein